MKAVTLQGMPHSLVADILVYIADNLRDQDLAEIKAMHGEEDPLDILSQSVLLSTHCWVIMDGRKPVGLFGAAPGALEGIGVAWMLGTDGITKSLSIARQTVGYLEEMHETYSVLFNFIDPNNTVSMRWLRWTGFELVGDRESASGHPLKLFARTANV